MWFIYIIQHNTTKQIYIGITKNLRQRLTQHNLGETTATHRKNGKWSMIYAEIYRNNEDAKDREKKLKHHDSTKHNLIKRNSRSFLY